MSGREPVGLSWVAISGFLRMVTHPRVLVHPMAATEATEHVREWLEVRSVLVIEPGKRFFPIFSGFLNSNGMGGNLTTDAFLAALAIQHQAELHSTDTDFFRFKGLRWRNPLQG